MHSMIFSPSYCILVLIFFYYKQINNVTVMEKEIYIMTEERKKYLIVNIYKFYTV